MTLDSTHKEKRAALFPTRSEEDTFNRRQQSGACQRTWIDIKLSIYSSLPLWYHSLWSEWVFHYIPPAKQSTQLCQLISHSFCILPGDQERRCLGHCSRVKSNENFQASDSEIKTKWNPPCLLLPSPIWNFLRDSPSVVCGLDMWNGRSQQVPMVQLCIFILLCLEAIGTCCSFPKMIKFSRCIRTPFPRRNSCCYLCYQYWNLAFKIALWLTSGYSSIHLSLIFRQF